MSHAEREWSNGKVKARLAVPLESGKGTPYRPLNEVFSNLVVFGWG